MQEINNWADRINLHQPMLFKDIHPKRPFKQEFAIKPEIEIKPAKNPWQKPEPDTQMAMYMSISFEPFTEDEDFHDVIEFLQFLDKNYERFKTIVNNIYTKIVGQFLQHVSKPLS